jgi:beta-glucosidase
MAVRQGGAGGVMCSYNRINSIYSCENPVTLGMLDRQFGFDGFVVSDWGAMHSTVASAKAGTDIEMNVVPGTYYGPALQTAVEDGQVPMSTLDDMVLRILRPMFRVEVFDHPPAAQPQAYGADVNTPAHQDLARQVAEEGAVLLKNDNGILPIVGQGKRIAVIGQAAGPAGAENEYDPQGSGHVPEVGSKPVVSPLAGITQRAAADGDTVVYADGSATQDAVAAAKAADVAVVVAGDVESEGTDRTDLTLSNAFCSLLGCGPSTGDQNSLISAVAAANPNTIVVLETGGPVLMPWLDQVKGVFEAWYPGEQGGDALAALLFGDVDPSGHLTETFPAGMSDLPTQSAAQYPGVTQPGDAVGPHSSYSEGLLVGYRWYDARNIAPLFPFGYGLSYTTFRYTGIAVSRTPSGASVTFTVTNTGPRAGAAVPQVYVGDPPAVGEPPKQLEGYRRVSLGPGQSATVTIALDPRAFAHWDTSRQAWVVSAGPYRVMVGSSSRDIAGAGVVSMPSTVVGG